MWLAIIPVLVIVLALASIVGFGIWGFPIALLALFAGAGAFIWMRGNQSAQRSSSAPESGAPMASTGARRSESPQDEPSADRPEHVTTGVAHSGQDRMTP